MGTGAVRRSRLREVAAIALLLLGGFVFLVGWVSGVVLLWASSAWTTRDKVIGTLILPGGLLLPLGLLLALRSGPSPNELCDGPRPGCSVLTVNGDYRLFGDGVSTGVVAVLIVLCLASLATGVYLALRLRTRRV